MRFVPDTHLLFSASKDSTIKCWDADNFQHVQTLKVRGGGGGEGGREGGREGKKCRLCVCGGGGGGMRG